jgi:ABC-type multidrug transport system ATPase subunit
LTAFANLDPTTVNRLKKVIKLAENKEITILVSSHDLQHTVEVCDRIVALNKGEIVKDIQTSTETLQELEMFSRFKLPYFKRNVFLPVIILKGFFKSLMIKTFENQYI